MAIFLMPVIGSFVLGAVGTRAMSASAWEPGIKSLAARYWMKLRYCWGLPLNHWLVSRTGTPETSKR